MADIKRYFSILYYLLLIVISVHSETSGNVGKIDMFSILNVNLSNIANEILDQSWAENLECLNELRAIHSGLRTSEKWSMKSGLQFTLWHFNQT